MTKTRQLVLRRIQWRTGTEGPPYDPYSYTEVTVTQRYQGDARPTVVTHHAGLGDWVRKDMNPICHNDPEGWFLQITGMTVPQAVKAYERLHPYYE